MSQIVPKSALKNHVYFEHRTINGCLMTVKVGNKIETVTFKSTGANRTESVDSFGKGILQLEKTKDKALINALKNDARFGDKDDNTKLFYLVKTKEELEAEENAKKAEKFTEDLKELNVYTKAIIEAMDEKTATTLAVKCGNDVTTKEGNKLSLKVIHNGLIEKLGLK